MKLGKQAHDIGIKRHDGLSRRRWLSLPDTYDQSPFNAINYFNGSAGDARQYCKNLVLPMHAPAMAMPGEQSRHQHPLVFCCTASWLRACLGAPLLDHPERCIAAARQLRRCCCDAASRANATAL
ncbi:hypothetical protein [Xanthomonas arboricola]|uniref:hypothetical protein n=1 Tax=Xanthomonas arboricola TaxID=56448 RepID=UPI000F8D48ED|nr:hypothetical protein [Xanthomonas arboricola]CAD2243228.1 hypothetical protein X12_000430 [Xanthomonas arboricola]